MLQICQYLLRNLSVSNLRTYASIAARSFSRSRTKPNAGLIIIGDEILKAQVKDTNSFFICSLLWECGVKVEKISVISDDVDTIAKEITDFSEKYRYVITSGGIGPTHDDMTFEGLAKAFNDSLHCHPTIVDIVKDVYRTEDQNSPAFKMAHVPRKAVLRFGKNQETGEALKFPCVNVENVYVFPGSPVYLEKLFKSLCRELFRGEKKFVKRELFLDAKEESFADALTKVAREFPNVAFGSYPITGESYYKARVTIESDNEAETLKAQERFSSLVPREVFINYDKHPHIDAHEKFSAFMESCQGEIYQKTLEDLRKLYEKSNEVAICFDGSIESTVLLHLAHIAQMQLGNSSKINLIMFRHEEWFPEVENFIKDITSRYNLNIITLNQLPQEGAKSLEASHPDIKILLLGIKSRNKDSGLYHSLARQTGIASMVIKCPLNGWTVDSLWTLARSLSLPYCSLYDKGYTCVGGRKGTKPNVNLITGDKETCQPAWKLNSGGK
ncbi:FAD synthase [Diachasma alloeum]|uniref:FAD synthase n=1 Tax=Diachasma alloeum TaxID=454923 RepID=UPI0007384E75|nr:FAD synthase [Diachasma alloeum]